MRNGYQPKRGTGTGIHRDPPRNPNGPKLDLKPHPNFSFIRALELLNKGEYLTNSEFLGENEGITLFIIDGKAVFYKYTLIVALREYKREPIENVPTEWLMSNNWALFAVPTKKEILT